MSVERMMISPPYLQFFISDPSATDVPIQGERIRIISSGECISVPCRYREEGETELIVGAYPDVRKAEATAFDGVIPTPSGIVECSDADGTKWITHAAAIGQTRIRIWTDGSTFPDRVVVGIG